MDLRAFEETIMCYLLFLVHIQQSIKLSAIEKGKVFDLSNEIANLIFSNVQSYKDNLNEYNKYDKEKILVKAFDEIKKGIENEFRNYKKDITISDVDFSYYNIINTLTDGRYAVSLNKNHIKQLLFYNELTGAYKKEKEEKKRLEETSKREEENFYELKKKAFLAMVHGNKNINPMRFFEINSYILGNCKIEDIKYVHDQTIEIKQGIYFIETKGERIIKVIYNNRIIDYSFKIIDMNEKFIIYIQGVIKINDSKEEFYINEQYPNFQFKSVINAYNLRKVIEIFNELGKANDSERNDNGPNDIDELLKGNLKLK